ncbi:hypothetical protein HanPI659440_Chr04g0167371 [Helianthus annuus]|nr:hypothetical protein HanPI659440_Chr04g0167371 [Helianthus annuus]
MYLWLIASEEGEKKVPASTYQNSLSYHGSAVNAIRFSPSGTGSHKLSPTSEPVNTAYVLSRKDLSRPVLMFPGASKAVVAVCFCPKAFSLRGLGTDKFRLMF